MPNLNAGAIRAIQRDWRVFPPACKIVTEDEQVTLLDYTPTQRQVVDAWSQHNRIFVCKYRQAKVTTVLVLAVLGMVMVTEGVQGLIIANAVDTGVVAFGRANFAYTQLPDQARIPLLGGRADPAKKQITFTHRGGIRVITGKVSKSAIGNSPDRVLLTEYAEYEHVLEFQKHFFPSVNKRANAKVAIETTPGLHGSVQHNLWLKSLAGNSRFTSVFLPWWVDESCRPIEPDFDPASIHPTVDELRYFERLHKHTAFDERFLRDRIAFRRLSIDSDFNGDPNLFDHKYPPGPLQGWVATTRPAIPQDVVDTLMREDGVAYGHSPYRIPDKEPHTGVTDVTVYALPSEDSEHRYLITCDPAGFGQTGDPSGLVVWDAITGREVAMWLGRTDPNTMAHRAQKIQVYYGVSRTMMVVESNKGEMLAALREMKARNVFYYKDGHPGLFSSEKVNDEAHNALVDLLRRGLLRPKNKETLTQLAAWDGKARTKRVVSGDTGETHHFELAICCRLAAWVFTYVPAYKNMLLGKYKQVPSVRTTEDRVFIDPEAALFSMLPKPVYKDTRDGGMIHGVGGCR